MSFFKTLMGRLTTPLGLLALIVLIGVGIFGVGGEVWAQSTPAAGLISDPVGWAKDRSIYLLGTIVTLLAWMGGSILLQITGAIMLLAEYNSFISSPAVTTGWVVVRDVSNMFFIIMMLVMGVGTMFGKEEYGYRRNLGRFVITALLVNFSRLFCGLMIDAGQVVMLTFVGAMSSVGGGNFAALLGIPSFFSAAPALPDGGSSLVATVISLILALIAIVIAIVVTGTMLLMLLFRIITLWFLIVLSPLVFVLGMFPRGASYYKDWWQQMVQNIVTGPILAFFLWLSFSIISTSNDVKDASSGLVNSVWSSKSSGQLEKFRADYARTSSSGESLQTGYTRLGTFDGIVSFVVGIGLMVISLQVAAQAGGKSGAIAGQAAKLVTDNLSGKRGVGKRVKQTGQKAAGNVLRTGVGFIKGGGQYVGRKVMASPGLGTGLQKIKNSWDKYSEHLLFTENARRKFQDKKNAAKVKSDKARKEANEERGEAAEMRSAISQRARKIASLQKDFDQKEAVWKAEKDPAKKRQLGREAWQSRKALRDAQNVQVEGEKGVASESAVKKEVGVKMKEMAKNIEANIASDPNANTAVDELRRYSVDLQTQLANELAKPPNDQDKARIAALTTERDAVDKRANALGNIVDIEERRQASIEEVKKLNDDAKDYEKQSKRLANLGMGDDVLRARASEIEAKAGLKDNEAAGQQLMSSAFSTLSSASNLVSTGTGQAARLGVSLAAGGLPIGWAPEALNALDKWGSELVKSGDSGQNDAIKKAADALGKLSDDQVRDVGRGVTAASQTDQLAAMQLMVEKNLVDAGEVHELRGRFSQYANAEAVETFESKLAAKYPTEQLGVSVDKLVKMLEKGKIDAKEFSKGAMTDDFMTALAKVSPNIAKPFLEKKDLADVMRDTTDRQIKAMQKLGTDMKNGLFTDEYRGLARLNMQAGGKAEAIFGIDAAGNFANPRMSTNFDAMIRDPKVAPHVLLSVNQAVYSNPRSDVSQTILGKNPDDIGKLITAAGTVRRDADPAQLATYQTLMESIHRDYRYAADPRRESSIQDRAKKASERT